MANLPTVEDVERSALEVQGVQVCPARYTFSIADVLQSASQFGENPSFLLEMLEELLEEYRNNPASNATDLSYLQISQRAQSLKGASANLRLTGLSETSRAVEIVAGALALSEHSLPSIFCTQEMQHLAANYTRDELICVLQIHIACLNRRTELVDDWLQSHRHTLKERLSSLG